LGGVGGPTGNRVWVMVGFREGGKKVEKRKIRLVLNGRGFYDATGKIRKQKKKRSGYSGDLGKCPNRQKTKTHPQVKGRGSKKRRRSNIHQNPSRKQIGEF